MNICDLPAVYRRNHDIAPNTFGQLVNVAKLISRFNGGTLDTNGLTVEVVNDWLTTRKDDGRSPRTVKGNRTSLLMLWREAHEIGEAPPPGKIRTVKCPDTIPVAFTHEELTRLFAYCKTLRGTFRKLKIPKRLYFLSLFNANYDTALRLGDLFSLERSWIWPGGYISIVQGKSGHSHRVQLRDETIRLIDDCMSALPNRRLIWPQFALRKRFYEQVKKIVKGAGIREGTTKWLRRSSASYIAREFGIDAASEHLGHRTPGLAKQFYIDPNICSPQRPLPPAIVGWENGDRPMERNGHG